MKNLLRSRGICINIAISILLSLLIATAGVLIIVHYDPVTCSKGRLVALTSPPGLASIAKELIEKGASRDSPYFLCAKVFQIGFDSSDGYLEIDGIDKGLLEKVICTQADKSDFYSSTTKFSEAKRIQNIEVLSTNIDYVIPHTTCGVSETITYVLTGQKSGKPIALIYLPAGPYDFKLITQ